MPRHDFAILASHRGPDVNPTKQTKPRTRRQMALRSRAKQRATLKNLVMNEPNNRANQRQNPANQRQNSAHRRQNSAHRRQNSAHRQNNSNERSCLFLRFAVFLSSSARLCRLCRVYVGPSSSKQFCRSAITEWHYVSRTTRSLY